MLGFTIKKSILDPVVQFSRVTHYNLYNVRRIGWVKHRTNEYTLTKFPECL